MAKVASKRFMLGVTVAHIVGALVVLYFTWREYRIVNANVASQCTVIAAQIGASNSENSRSYSFPEVTIEHEVNGKAYRRVDEGPHENLSSDVRIPKVGSRMSCYYVDGHPDLVTIFPGKPTTTKIYIGLAVFIMLLPLLYYFLNERQKRRG